MVALLGIGVGAGVSWQARHQSGQLADVQTDLRTCQGNASNQAIAIGDFRQRAENAAAQLESLRTLASAALDQRDALVRVIETQAKVRETAATKVTHETPDCRALAVMPVCPALADRLWGQVAAPDTHAGH
ncbi:hypothetical protein [Rhodanobacter lindaniclasticus]